VLALESSFFAEEGSGPEVGALAMVDALHEELD
jgi:hypothetical protein